MRVDQAAHYVVKDSIMQAYELVPEAYRQKFRSARKLEQHTFVEFAREKECLFDRWCSAQKVRSREDLRQLVLLEDFKNCLPEAVAVYLNEQEVQRLDEASVLVDEFSIMEHNTLFGVNYNLEVEVTLHAHSPRLALAVLPLTEQRSLATIARSEAI